MSLKSFSEWKTFQSDLNETSVFKKCLSRSIGLSIKSVDFDLNMTCAWKKCKIQKVLSVERCRSTVTEFIHWHDLSDSLFSLGYAREKYGTPGTLFLLCLSWALMLPRKIFDWTHCVIKLLKIYSRTCIYDN